jgi:hypothetical protein
MALLRRRWPRMGEKPHGRIFAASAVRQVQIRKRPGTTPRRHDPHPAEPAMSSVDLGRRVPHFFNCDRNARGITHRMEPPLSFGDGHCECPL